VSIQTSPVNTPTVSMDAHAESGSTASATDEAEQQKTFEALIGQVAMNSFQTNYQNMQDFLAQNAKEEAKAQKERKEAEAADGNA